ncbi:hemolysin III family protein [Erythrobacter sp. YT30]|uniref:PAQR family membrane homeostasis protein TrhA n=1 Tax=Erythrobacter sp. YT30 TaxID=1735012 RepID=UPI00076C66B4|nr:hemolysin III family protein [Erythrobacter sp. YT30]KWV93234.1 hypothetical protein AUC45_03695 [Erythrobacter sp. YT30]
MQPTDHSPTFPSKTAAERRADFAIHAVSLVGFATACGFLMMRGTERGDPLLLIAILVYAFGAIFSISISFAYHLLPRHQWRGSLRKWDHAAIYVVIAGTFTPLLVRAGTDYAYSVLVLIWICAIAGFAVKLNTSNLDSRWSLMSYLGLGGFALIALPSFWSELPLFSTIAIVLGGTFYTIGTQFYRRKEMVFRYPIWHTFGTLGGTAFLVAIWVAVSA